VKSNLDSSSCHDGCIPCQVNAEISFGEIQFGAWWTKLVIQIMKLPKALLAYIARTELWKLDHACIEDGLWIVFALSTSIYSITVMFRISGTAKELGAITN
jgi:hypothetical protein